MKAHCQKERVFYFMPYVLGSEITYETI
jgi:hypothetical protein